MRKGFAEPAQTPHEKRVSCVRRLTHCVPWIAMAIWLVSPLFVAHERWLLAYFAQAAAMIVFALSYNLLLGETGLLSFGHAAYAGLGAFVAAHLFNRGVLALPLLPFAGGVAGAAFGAVFGLIATRRAGTAFAMITLGIGELIAAAVWTLPDGFGGAAGVAIDRTSGPAWGALTFAAQRHAYALIAAWAALSIIAMFALTRTPLAKAANAVRDNAVRVATLGIEPRQVRWAMFVFSAFFAGVAGTLTLIDVELASSESVSMTRSGAVLIATVIGGASIFWGPAIGALVLTGLSVALASVTPAWPVYVGLLFVGVVLRCPEGIAPWWRRHLARGKQVGVWRRASSDLLGAFGGAVSLCVLVIVVESLYARRLAADAGGMWRIGPFAFDLRSASTWAILAALVVLGAASYCARRRVLRGAVQMKADVTGEGAR